MHNDYEKDYEDMLTFASDLLELVDNIMEYVQENMEENPILAPIFDMELKFLGLDKALNLGQLKYLQWLEDTYKFDNPDQLNIDDI